MSSHADRNLLLGILALQLDFVSKEQLIAAMNAWVLNKSRPLDEILLERQALDGETHLLLVSLVNKHLERHGNDGQQSLAALSSIGTLRRELTQIGDLELEETLQAVSSMRYESAASESAANEGEGDDELGKTLSVGQTSSRGDRFQILRPHAKGGLGEVSVARDGELNREVALKEIQATFVDDPNSRARFVLEAEITGGLEHPGIVPVYGLGQYDDGRPFYAMRFVRGDSLKEAVDRFHNSPDLTESQRSLQMRQLLGRFVDVCQAMEYAHSRGVLHRDLKPGNIMLGKYGETLVVDWGLAKPVGRSETPSHSEEPTLTPQSGSGSAPTQLGTALGTPAYMSPEQAAGRLDELGAPSDVYSLGATLYYLLTGRSPFSNRDLASILRAVQEGNFRRPREINPTLNQSLEAVCLKAMSVSPSDRYESPQALAADIERYLADEPVTAIQEPLTLRTKRWVRKHPAIVASTAAALLVSVLGSIAFSTVLAGKNTELEEAIADLRVANENERIAAEKAVESKAVAEDKADEATDILKFFEKTVLAAGRPSGEPGGLSVNATVLEAVDNAAKSAADAFTGRPLVEASVRSTLGKTYATLREDEKSVEQYRRCYELIKSEVGDADPRVSKAGINLGLALLEVGDVGAAEPLIEAAAAAVDDRYPLDDRRAQRPLRVLGELRMAQERPLETIEILVPIHEAIQAADTRPTADEVKTANNLGAAYEAVGQPAKAVETFRLAYDASREVYGADHPTTLTTLSNVAFGLRAAGQVKESIELSREVIRAREVVLGREHGDVLMTLNNLAFAQMEMGEVSEALKTIEDCYERTESKLGRTHPQTLNALLGVAEVRLTLGRDDAIAAYANYVIGSREAFADEPATLAFELMRVGYALHEAKRWSDCEPYFAEAADLLRDERVGLFGLAASLRGEALVKLGRTEEAKPVLSNAEVALGSIQEPDAYAKQRLEVVRALSSTLASEAQANEGSD